MQKIQLRSILVLASTLLVFNACGQKADLVYVNKQDPVLTTWWTTIKTHPELNIKYTIKDINEEG